VFRSLLYAKPECALPGRLPFLLSRRHLIPRRNLPRHADRKHRGSPLRFAGSSGSRYISHVTVSALPYPVLCAALGLVIGWIPALLHGPISYKFDVLYVKGAIAVWAFYGARLLIGLMVGITSTPRRWWIRGPFVGFLMLFPVGLIALATPGCGPT